MKISTPLEFISFNLIKIRHRHVGNLMTFFQTPVNVIRYSHLVGEDKQFFCLIYSFSF